MTTKHTPGPWERDGEYVQQAGQTEVGICSVLNMDEGGNKGWYHGPVTQANARLIASAPELLDLLSALECDINTLVYCYERKPDNFGRAVAVAKADAERARAAIAKAKGEQQ